MKMGRNFLNDGRSWSPEFSMRIHSYNLIWIYISSEAGDMIGNFCGNDILDEASI